MAAAVPFTSTAERINDLRVTLSSIKTLARDGQPTRKNLDAIHKAARHALERDLSRATATPSAATGVEPILKDRAPHR